MLKRLKTRNEALRAMGAVRAERAEGVWAHKKEGGGFWAHIGSLHKYF